MRPFRSVLAATSLAVLAACGGPTVPPGPVTPNATSVNPTVAERGAAIVIAGSGFGTTPGTVKVGDAAATVTNWTASSITATVPAGAANAWQDVSVTTAGGTDTLTGLFVGAEFTGTGPQLQAFLDGLDPGIAVLLQASTYDLSAQVTPFIIDNKDLHGRGQTETTLVQPTTAQTYVFADFGASRTIADLTVKGEGFTYLHGKLSDTVIPLSVAGPPERPGDLEGVAAYVAQLLNGAPLTPAAADNPTIILDHVTFDSPGASTWGTPIILPKVDLVLRDSTVDVPDGMVWLLSGGDIEIESSTVTTGFLQAIALTGSLSVGASGLTSTTTTILAAESGLTVEDSTVRVLDGDLDLIGAAATVVGGQTLQIGGAIEVVRSTIEALDADLVDATLEGHVRVETQFAPIRFADNVLLHSHDSFEVIAHDSQVGEGDIEVIRNPDVRIGVFAAESVLGARPASLTLVASSSGLRNRLTIADNGIRATEAVLVTNASTPGDVFATGNTITAGDGAMVGSVEFALAGDGLLEATDNEITARYVAIGAISLAGERMSLRGNTFKNVAGTDGILIIQGVGGSCEVTDTVFDLDDPTDSFSNGIAFICSAGGRGDTFTVTGNDVTATGATTSTIIFVADSLTAADVSDNRLHTAQLVVQGPDSTVEFTSNDVELESEPLVFFGNDLTHVTASHNTVVHHDPAVFGLELGGMGTAIVTDNVFTGQGTPSATATALGVEAIAGAVTVTATGNTFTNYSRALSIQDVAVAALGITAAITNNVFDFTIDAAPKVATLLNVKDAIDATNNQWGTNTVLATVQGYVTLAGDTAVQGGSIDLDPITLP